MRRAADAVGSPLSSGLRRASGTRGIANGKIADVDVDYRTISEELESGEFRRRLRDELSAGFREMHAAGERLPPPSYYATKTVEVIHAGAPVPFTKDAAYDLYQEALLACEEARDEVLGA